MLKLSIYVASFFNSHLALQKPMSNESSIMTGNFQLQPFILQMELKISWCPVHIHITKLIMTVTSSLPIATLSSPAVENNDTNILHWPVQTLLAKSVEPEPFSVTWKPCFSFFLIVSVTTDYTSWSENFNHLSVQNK